MGLTQILEQKKSLISKEWFDQVAKTYPGEVTRFLKEKNDPFANPVGASTKQSLDTVIDTMIHGDGRDSLAAALDPVIRVRAVQEFTPSAAVAFIFFLKTIFRDVTKEAPVSESELLQFDRKIDELSLIAFDVYMGCREQIFKFRADHVKSRTLKLLEKADILCEVPEVGTEIIPHNVYKNGGFEDE